MVVRIPPLFSTFSRLCMGFIFAIPVSTAGTSDRRPPHTSQGALSACTVQKAIGKLIGGGDPSLANRIMEAGLPSAHGMMGRQLGYAVLCG